MCIPRNTSIDGNLLELIAAAVDACITLDDLFRNQINPLESSFIEYKVAQQLCKKNSQAIQIQIQLDPSKRGE